MARLVDGNDLAFVNANHSVGKKKVFFSNDSLPNALTQIAYGKLEPFEETEVHMHETMWEYFYILDGEGQFIVNNQLFNVNAGSVIEISPNERHNQRAGANGLCFFYFGASELSF